MQLSDDIVKRTALMCALVFAPDYFTSEVHDGQ